MEFTIKDINDYLKEDKQFEEIYKLIKDFDDYLYNEAYLFEGVKYYDVNTLKNAVKKSYGDSVSTTKAVLGAGNKVAKSLGNFYRHSYNFIMKCIHFIASTISFILDTISSIPQTINRCIDKLGSLSETVIAKINGDIMLHITHSDIEYLYKSDGEKISLMDNLLKFKGIAELLKDEKIWEVTKSQYYNYNGKKVSLYSLMFGYALAKHHKVISKSMVGNKDSLENAGIIQTLEHIYSELKHITFNKSKINMSLLGNRSIYLQHPENNSNDALIKITQNGQTEEFKYYLPALNRLISDLSDMKNELKKLSDTLTNKISIVFSKNFADLNEESQKMINKIVPCIANVFKLISTILMYAKNDVSTIEKIADKILQVQNKS